MGCKPGAFVLAAFGVLVTLAALYPARVLAQDCTPADIELHSQAEVDAFQADHGPCDRATNLHIQGADIVNFEGLAGLVSVSGRLSIYSNQRLTHVTGFPALAQVGALDIVNNESLVAIDGLNALESTDSWLLIRINHRLERISGLTKLSHVGENLWISGSWDLAELDGLSAVTSVSGDLMLWDSSALTNLDSLAGLGHVAGDVAVSRNGNLIDCDGLTRLIDGEDDDEPGPGPGGADVPDVGGEVYLQENGAGCNSVRQILLGIDSFKINPGLNDAWYDPGTPGQGFLLTVLPDVETVFLAWFTFDTERPGDGVNAHLGDAGQRWLTAQGPYYEDHAELDIYLTGGGLFDSDEPAPETGAEPIGRISIRWDECENAWLNYSMTAPGLSGYMQIRRIVPDNLPLCEALSVAD